VVPRGRLTVERILVTGASGLVGTRLCEHLRAGQGVCVRAAIHDARRAIRLARLDTELVTADLADATSLERAVEGCDAVVHCAYGTSGTARARRSLTGEAAGELADLALRAGVRRFVHLSSVAVWGFSPAQTELDEDVPASPLGHPYVDGKIDAERGVATAQARGLATVVLRPTNVFGPWAPAFTVAPVQALRSGAIALVGEGSGPANHLYVDNLVHAIDRALASDDAVGGTFVVSDPDGVSWRELYDAYAQTASPAWPVRSIPLDEYRRLRGRPGPRAVLMSAAERPVLRAVGRTVARVVPGVRNRVRRIADGGGDTLPSEELAAVQTSGVSFRLDRARDVLGYDPPVAFDEAIRLTREWLRFARLV
jgi:nucleoside-diphosphate-sugar epimerase